MHTPVPPIRPPEEGNAESRLLEAFQHLRQRLRHLAAMVTGNDDDADDVLQDVFVRMWDKRQRLHSVSEASALLTTSVKHASIDVVRRRQSHDAGHLDTIAETDIPADESPDDSVESRFLAVQQIIRQQLSPAQQRILVMHDYENRDYGQIAQLLHMNEAAVRMQLSRARKAVRDAYREGGAYT